MLEISGYEILEQIGQGGMAEVYRARHTRLDRYVALKILHNHYSDDPSFAERFIREARIAASLNHPNIVQIFDVNRAGETLFLAMEYVSGGDLTHNFHPPINQKMLLKLLAQLCSALDFAHEHGYIHRDIKPANILFRENGTLALTDFGIARAIHSDTNMTQAGTVIGTPSYMSPEQAQGYELTAASDLYSAAVIVYQYVTGELPYQADSSITIAIKHISDPVPRLPTELQALQSFFDRALAKLPGERFKDGKTLYQNLQANIAKLPVTAPKADTSMIVVPHGDTNAFQSLTVADGALLAPEDQQHQDRANHNPHASNVLQSESGWRGPKTNSLTATMRYIFIQVNKLVINVFPANLKPYSKALIIAAGVLLGMGLAYLLVALLQPATKLNEQDRLRVAQLLVAANENLQKGQLISPPFDNAFQKYQAVLALAPADSFADNGIKDIANRVAEQANLALAANNIAVASDTIASLNKVMPDHPRLAELTERLTAIEQTRAADTAQRLQQAQYFAAQNQYDEALQIYAALVQQYPQHTATAEDTDKLAGTLLQEAEAAMQSKRFTHASSLLASASTAATLAANAEKIDKAAALTTTLDQKIKSATRDAKVAQLLAQADQAMQRYHMDSPRQGSANELFDQVLTLSPGNQQARAGKESIVNWLENSIVSASAKGDITKAKSYFARLAALQAHHPRLKQLQKTVAVAEKTAARQQAVDAKVNELFRRADIYLGRDQTKSADKIHRKIKSLAPDDKRLYRLGLSIADGYAVLAQRELDASDWRDAQVWVTRGLAHAPNHGTLQRQGAEAAKALQAR